VHGRRSETLTVHVDRLDDCLPPGYVPHFVKIDVEGAEAEVIAGGVDTLRLYHPPVVFEHGSGGRTRPAELHGLLTDAGYDVFDIDGVGPYSLARMEEVFDEGKLWNWLALER